MKFQKLNRNFFLQDTASVAQQVLGHYLIFNRDGIEQIGKIVEVEAYLGQHDLAAHSSKGLTSRTKTLFGPPGHAYIYLIYGIHHCMNMVTGPEGQGSGVLVRALEPIRNLTMKTNGPGLLCKAMGIDKKMNAHDLLSDNLYIAKSDGPMVHTIIKRPRIGVDYAGIWAKKKLRFYIKDNPYVSKP